LPRVTQACLNRFGCSMIADTLLHLRGRILCRLVQDDRDSVAHHGEEAASVLEEDRHQTESLGDTCWTCCASSSFPPVWSQALEASIRHRNHAAAVCSASFCAASYKTTGMTWRIMARMQLAACETTTIRQKSSGTPCRMCMGMWPIDKYITNGVMSSIRKTCMCTEQSEQEASAIGNFQLTKPKWRGCSSRFARQRPQDRQARGHQNVP
jgi:hypothetical protein